nr:hypothetical protein [Micromonospora sp. DSM 115978]
MNRRRLYRLFAVAFLTLVALPLFASAAAAEAVTTGNVGEAYDPDPLTAIQAWAIYGGTIVGGFLIAVVLTMLSSRSSGPARYRPGQPWNHDEVWIGSEPKVAEGERARAAVPGTGGASGTW